MAHRTLSALAASALVCSALSACATPYRPCEFALKDLGRWGYDDVELSPRTYEVSFQGNQHTPLHRVEDFALLRSAELALEKGDQFFVILDKWNKTSYAHLGTGTALPRYKFRIQLFRSKPDGDELFVYDATIVQRALRREYELEPVPLVSDPVAR